MDQIDAARRRGLDVSCDTTSYATGIGVMAAVLPPWLFDEGPASLPSGSLSRRSASA